MPSQKGAVKHRGGHQGTPIAPGRHNPLAEVMNSEGILEMKTITRSHPDSNSLGHTQNENPRNGTSPGSLQGTAKYGRILIADDEETVLESTADLLRLEGYHI